MSEFKIDPDCLLLFIDDTGHERFADKQFPIFGLGGCAVMGSTYEHLLRNPWFQMKNEYFDGSQVLLHAADLRNPSSSQIQAIATFFRDHDFSRFCAISRITSRIDESMVPYDATATCLIERIRRVASWYPFKTIAMIFEASDRGDKLAARFFPNFTFAVDGSNVPIEYRRAGKSLCEPGLEVADFIMHTAGAQVRDQMIGKVDGPRRFRKDFECVFHSVDKRKADYLLIDSVIVTKAGA
jgi:hypothetical protein